MRVLWVGGKSEEAGHFHLTTLTPNTPVDETSPCLFWQQDLIADLITLATKIKNYLCGFLERPREVLVF